ncbi:MAG TPA: helix-turn-helix domain-containing protein [Quisquiliibacterium sp.]|nr:helix-turn-helix domain-containing protein [Quisquiliibacterium sp.]HPA89191.1 helix-turn-helix domain-containing protein [Quisquiliibacterium sp.]HQP67096.1 helix-turn-helix domain-containing protein [Quisquiliibacterium sp.]
MRMPAPSSLPSRRVFPPTGDVASALRFVPPPPDLRAWLDGGVVVQGDAQLRATRFPAQVGSMLVVRVAGAVHGSAGASGVACDGAHALLPRAAFIGAATQATQYLHAGAVHAVGLLVRPEAVPALLRASAAPVVDTRVALADALGGGWTWLEDAVCDAHDDDARLARLFAAVRAAVTGDVHASRLAALHRMRAAIERLPVPDAADALGIGARQFERRFRDAFGMGPKQFQVIARLQRALHAVAPAQRAPRHGVPGHGAPGQGAHLAADHGYFDQAHLARDVRRLAGAPLGRLRLEAARPGSEYWPLAIGRSAAALR